MRTWSCEMFWRVGYRPRDARGPCGCCTTCHDDFDTGYADMCEGTFKGRQYHVCCRMAETLKAAIPKYWQHGPKWECGVPFPHIHYGENVVLPYKAECPWD